MNRPVGWGIGIPPETSTPEIVQAELDLLKPQHYMNWRHTPYEAQTDAFFLPMAWGKDFNRAGVASRLASNPGEIWLLWNEPEWADQANMSPQEAADLTWEFLTLAEQLDTEYQWAAPGVAINWDDTDGLLWMTEYVKILRRKKGIMRPSYWHIHGYRSPFARKFTDGWQKWVEWYNVWGVGAPVILSEVCAEAAELEAQKTMINMVNVLLSTGSVVAATWFSSHPSRVSNWVNAALTEVVDGVVRLTTLGEYWMQAR